MKLTHFISVCTFVLCSSAFITRAQAPENNVKLNLMGIGLSNYSFQYERILGKKITGSMGFRFMPGRGLPSVLLSNDSSGSTIGTTKISGICFTPEFRWYPATDEGAPHGFYFAPYLRYSRFKVTLDDKFYDPVINRNSDVTFTGKFSGFGGGLMIGYQWLIKDRVTIDWWILGAHYGASKFSLAVEYDFSKFQGDERIDVENDIEGNLQDIPSVKSVDANITNSEAKVTAKLPFVGLRSGLCIGVAF